MRPALLFVYSYAGELSRSMVIRDLNAGFASHAARQIIVEVHMNEHSDSTAPTDDPRSFLSFQDILETVSHEPGQGRLLDQIEKILRVQQRERLHVILSQVAEDQLLPCRSCSSATCHRGEKAIQPITAS